MSIAQPKRGKMSAQFLLLAVFLSIVFATGGSSRDDEFLVAILRPISLFFGMLALVTLGRKPLAEYRMLLGGCCAVIALALAYLVPLPPDIWKLLRGGEDLLLVETLANVEAGWRPLTLSPASGWQSLLALTPPLTVVLLTIQLNRDDRFLLLPLLIVLAAISGLVGLLQSAGNASSPLYMYRVTNSESAVGLFANRNHAATLLACLLPMLAAYASTGEYSAGKQRSRQLWCAIIAVVLIPLILVTGSRSGLFAAVIGLAGAGLLYRSTVRENPKRSQGKKKIWGVPQFAGGLIVLGLGLLTLFFSRAVALERLFGNALRDDGRQDFVLVSADLFWKYFPWGSGTGSFVEVFKLAEPTNLLDPSYLNHAHNDWAETAVTFGLPGVIFLAVIIFLYARLTYHVWRNSDSSRRSVSLARMASVAMGIIAVASLSDYPLRTPIMMSVLAWLVVILVRGAREPIK